MPSAHYPPLTACVLVVAVSPLITESKTSLESSKTFLESFIFIHPGLLGICCLSAPEFLIFVSMLGLKKGAGGDP